MTTEDKLWTYFREVNAAVEAANTGKSPQPFQRGTFLVTALSGEVELSIKDVTEEDAILISAELKNMGIRADIHASQVCPHCQKRVPEELYCSSCRAKIAN